MKNELHPVSKLLTPPRRVCWPPLGRSALAGFLILTGFSAWGGGFVQDTNTSAIFDYIVKSEYFIRNLPDQSVHKSANRAQNMRFTYYDDGFAVEPRDYGQTQGKPRPWQATIRLLGLGRTDGAGPTLASAQWTVSGNAASVHVDPVVI
jgi:hypothetical protein